MVISSTQTHVMTGDSARQELELNNFNLMVDHDEIVCLYRTVGPLVERHYVMWPGQQSTTLASEFRIRYLYVI